MAPASTIQTQRRAKSTCPSSDRPARLDCSPRPAAVDHEGVITQRTALIERGVVTGFYHNLISAAQFDAISTGNGYRDLINPSAPTNVRVAIGQANLSDVLKNLDDGLLIDLIGDSDASIGLNGDFARTIVLAYQIKRGSDRLCARCGRQRRSVQSAAPHRRVR